MTTAEAYAACRVIAQREAKKFLLSFRVLPERKRNAMCAVYAFMRRADDIADDETMPIAGASRSNGRWLEAWRDATPERGLQDPVFVALNDTQGDSDPRWLLEQLVRGTTMDLGAFGGDDGDLQSSATFR